MAAAAASFLFLLFLLLPPSSPILASKQHQQLPPNITQILSSIPGFDLFNRLLSRTNVALQINSRSSLTILSPHNSVVQPLLNSYAGGIPTQQMSDLLRYHVLLQYLDFTQTPQGMPAGWRLVTTLYQTTGRAAGNFGAVNVTREQNGIVEVGLPLNGVPPNATIVSTLKLVPYTLSVVQISKILIPVGLTSPAPPSSLLINITNQLAQSNRFSFFLLFLQVTGVDKIFEDSESKEGITIFAPTDQAFQKFRVQSFKMLSAEHKILVLEYHALNTFYPLGTLNSFKNPVTPTIATTDPRSGGAGQFTVNVSGGNGVVTISDGSVSSPVVATILEHEPVAIFAIDDLLFPKTFLGTPPAKLPPSLPPLVSPSPRRSPSPTGSLVPSLPPGPPSESPVPSSSAPTALSPPSIPSTSFPSPLIFLPSSPSPSSLPSPSASTTSQADASQSRICKFVMLGVMLACWLFIL